MSSKKFAYIFTLLSIVGLVLSACASQPPAVNTPETETGSGESSIIGFDDLVAALQAAGAQVEPAGEVEQVFLSASGQIIKLNGVDVQVFEYATPEAAEAEAGTISPDGTSTNTTMITWIDAPHFYRWGKLIVLYVGSDEGVISLLEGILGPQFAGQ